MLITRSDDGYFGLRQSLTGVFDKAVSSWLDNASEEHGLTEDGKTVALFPWLFVLKALPLQQSKRFIFRSFPRARVALPRQIVILAHEVSR